MTTVASASHTEGRTPSGVPPGTLTIGTDNGSAFTARAFKLVLSGLGIAHRRGGYRDPQSQAFIQSWFPRSSSAASGRTSSRHSTMRGR
jgi:putative transposase